MFASNKALADATALRALDKIIEQLNDAASSGEKDPLDAAAAIAVNVRANYARLRGIDAGKAEEFQQLAAEFDAYYGAARTVAIEMMDKSGAPDPQSLQAMSAKLDTYRKDLLSFRNSANSRFSGTIGDGTSDADGAVSTGIVIGLLSLCLTLGFGIVIARALLRQLQQALKVAQTVAAGDLTSRTTATKCRGISSASRCRPRPLRKCCAVVNAYPWSSTAHQHSASRGRDQVFSPAQCHA